MAEITRFSNPQMAEQGFDPWVQRQSVGLNIDDERLDNDGQYTDNGIPGQKLRDLTVDKLLAGSIRVTTFIQSTGYVPGVSGWYIDGAGNASFNNIILIGGNLSYGKTSFTDSTHAGYWISPDGIYFGAVGDTTYLKYSLSTEEITVVGTLQTAIGTGQRVELSAADNTLKFFNTANFTEVEIGGTEGSLAVFRDDDLSGPITPFFVSSSGTAVDGVIAIISDDDASENSTGIVLSVNSDGKMLPLAVSVNSSSSDQPAAGFVSKALQEDHFWRVSGFDGVDGVSVTGSNILWFSDGEDPNGTLTADNVGDVLFNADGNIYVAQGGTVWSVLGSGTSGVTVYDNGSSVATEPGINFIGGANTSFTITDDPGNSRVDVQVDVNTTPVPAPSPVGDSITRIRTASCFETAARFNTVTTGGGSVINWTSQGVVPANTATGSDEHQFVNFAIGALTVGDESSVNLIANNPVFTTMFKIGTASASMGLYTGIGVIGMTGSTIGQTSEHIGFIWDNTTFELAASAANGVTQTRSVLASGVVAGDWVEVFLVKTGSASVDYYCRLNSGALSGVTTITSNIPTTFSSAAQNQLAFMCCNQSSGGSSSAIFGSFCYER